MPSEESAGDGRKTTFANPLIEPDGFGHLLTGRTRRQQVPAGIDLAPSYPNVVS